MWAACAPLEASALCALLSAKASVQLEALAFLELRRRAAGAEAEQKAALAARMEEAARALAARLPEPAKAEQQLAALKDVRDNRVAASLLAALAFGARAEVGGARGGG